VNKKSEKQETVYSEEKRRGRSSRIMKEVGG
jgi:hypothetical protein